MNSRETRAAWRPLPEFNAITHLDANGEPTQGQNAVFNVDRVFDEGATTQELYTSVCSKVVSSVVNGINGTVFAYGQTSSGKTRTMQGGGAEMGVLQLAAEDIFALIEASEHTDFSIRASYTHFALVTGNSTGHGACTSRRAATSLSGS
jgi:centromeric protein E